MDDPVRDRSFLKDLVGKGQVFEISEKIASFARLSEAIGNDIAALDARAQTAEWRESLVTGQIIFGLADEPDRVATLVGHVEAQVAAVCQRCLTLFELPLRTELKLQFSSPGAVSEARDDYELWELSDALVSPLEIVDEALVMAMPLSARHEDSTYCVEFAQQDDKESVMPFASLRAQLDEGRNNE